MSRRSWSSTTPGWPGAARGRFSSRRGFDVVEAEDGMAALESYFVEKPDIVLLDLVMKGMYGLEVLARLREMDPDGQGHRRVGGRADVVA